MSIVTKVAKMRLNYHATMLDICNVLGSASMTDEEYLAHYGMPRRSGRYPWGSGKNGYQSSRDFLGRVEQMRKSGFTYTDENGKKWTGDNAIAKSLGYNSTDFRTVYAIAKDERRSDMVATAKRLRDKEGMNNSEIGRKMGINESSVRSLLDPNSESRMKQARDTAKFLKEQVDKKGMVDVGAGVNNDLKITKEKLDQALFILQAEGNYEVYGGRFSQVTNKGQMTTQRVLCKPGTPHSAIYDFDNVKTVTDYISRDDGKTYEKKFTYPESLDSKRLMIRYKEDGGIDRDGTVELRRNVPDLSLGESKYSQVRIMVDGKKYIKGMAVYKDDKDFPPGVDVIFNTNKSKSVPKLEVLKDVKPDPDNPFGSLIKDADQGGQYWYTDKNGKKKLGLINKRSDEGDWTEWKDALPSQFLSKQSKAMAEKQLGIAKADKQAEYEAIMALTNPTVKKYYLDKFASSCDSAAVHLKAAALPGQKYHVILPVTSLSEKEVYAPGYPDGSKLALVRYPHGGTFEIPICTVNNKNKDASHKDYITFDKGNIILGDSASASKLKLTKDSIQFKGTSDTAIKPDSDATAWITGKVFHINSGEIESSLKFGKVQLRPSSNNTLIIRDPDDTQDIAEFGSVIKIGKTNGQNVQIDKDGLRVFSWSNTIAHIGYGPANVGNNKYVDQSFYTFGVRKKGSLIGGFSVAEGDNSTASGYCAHAEGAGCVASGDQSHAEGCNPIASGQASHAQGVNTVASGECSCAGGEGSKATERFSCAIGNHVIAASASQTVIGKYNTQDASNAYSLIIGNGGSDTTRSNALTVGWGGDITAPRLTSKADLYFGFAGGNSFRPYYTKGNSASFKVWLMGYTTSGMAEVLFFMPFSRPIIGASGVSVSSVNGLIIRQNNKYLYGSTATVYVKPSSYTSEIVDGGQGVNIRAKMPNTTNVTNNTACAITASIKITFS